MNEDIIKIITPSKEIFDLIEDYKRIVKNALPKANITLIGSFGVPMCGKEEIDLLVETDDVKESQLILNKNGFGIGPIVEGEGFSINKKYDITCELHIVPRGHKKIRAYLSLIKKLQNDKTLLEKYELLKWSLNGKSKEIYKLKKNDFLVKHNLV